MKRFFWSRGAKIVYAITAVTLVVAVGWVAYQISTINASMLQVGTQAKDWSLQTPAGETIRFYEHSGARPSLILFWATWCPSCGKLMPELAELQASLPEGSVNFYALNVSEDGDPVAYFKEHGYRFHLLLNADEVQALYGAFGTPRVFLVDGNKIVQYTLKATTSREKLMTDLRARLAAPAT